MTPRKKPRIKKAPPPPTPKAVNPWDVPPPPARGDVDKNILYAAIGRALSDWERFEEVMARIFAALVGAGETTPAERAYGSVLAFRGRADMIKAAAEAFFFLYPEVGLQKLLADVVDDGRQFAARRNEIAHGIVKENEPPWPGFFDPKYPTGFVLGPPSYATNKTQLTQPKNLLAMVGRDPEYVYASSEIDTFAAHFKALHSRGNKIPLELMYHRQRAQSQA